LPRRNFDSAAKRYIRKNPHVVEGVIPQIIPHSDFRTPEYTRFSTIQNMKWEATRGMSNSFGFNRHDTEDDYLSAEQLLSDFIDGVSKGGNLLLNVGPRGTDAGIPDEQLSRLKVFGGWLAVNGAAVYGTAPWKRGGSDNSDAQTDSGIPVRFTRRGSDINIIFLGNPSGSTVRLRDVSLTGEGRLVSDGSPVTLRADGVDLVLEFRTPLAG